MCWGLSAARRLEQIRPHFENSLSLATEVAGIARYWRATIAMLGNRVWLLAHQLNGLMSSDSQGSAYHLSSSSANFWRSHDADVWDEDLDFCAFFICSQLCGCSEQLELLETSSSPSQLIDNVMLNVCEWDGTSVKDTHTIIHDYELWSQYFDLASTCRYQFSTHYVNLSLVYCKQTNVGLVSVITSSLTIYLYYYEIVHEAHKKLNNNEKWEHDCKWLN